MIEPIFAATGAHEFLDPMRFLGFMVAAYTVVWGGITTYAVYLLLRLKGVTRG